MTATLTHELPSNLLEVTTFHVTFIVVGGSDPAAVLETLSSIAEGVDRCSDMRINVVVIAAAVCTDQVLDQISGDVIAVHPSGASEAESLNVARRLATGQQHHTIVAGERLTEGAVRYLAAKAGLALDAHKRSGGSTAPLGERMAELGIRIGESFMGDPHLVVIEGPTALHAGVHANQPLHVGAFTYSWSCLTGALAVVGRYCSIAANVRFGESEHPIHDLTTSVFAHDDGHHMAQHMDRTGRSYVRRSRPQEESFAPITVGSDVWIGSRAYIKGGVTLGHGCVVGTNAVVTKDVPPYAVVVGNPGRVVKQRFDDQTVSDLLDLAWWQFDCADFHEIDTTDVSASIGELKRRSSSGELRPYRGNQRTLAELARLLES